MRLLAVETSTLTGAVALLETGGVVAESRVSVAVTHGERLMAAIDGVLRAARWELADVEAFAVAHGPRVVHRAPDRAQHGQGTRVRDRQAGRRRRDTRRAGLAPAVLRVSRVPRPGRAEERGVRGALPDARGRLELLGSPAGRGARDPRGGAARRHGRAGRLRGGRGRAVRAGSPSISSGARACLAPADLRGPSAVTVGELAGWALDRGRGRRPGGASCRSTCAHRKRSSRASDDRVPDVRIEPMRAADLDAVLEIERASFETPWSRQAFLHELERNRVAGLWVARGERPGEAA